MTGAVVVNGRFLAARPTGLHRVARSLLHAAAEVGIEYEVFAPRGTSDPLVDRTLPAPPGRAGHHFWEQVILPAAAGKRTVLSLTNLAPLAARHGVVMIHDLATLVGPQWFRPELRLYGRLALAAARRAELVITVSQQVAGELVGAGIAEDRIRVVRNAVDSRFRPQPPEEVERVRRSHGLNGPYVVHVGWADPRKDVATALAAHLDAAERTPHQLVLVGARHRNFPPVDLPAGPSIRHLGYVDDDDLPALLTGAAALLLPSLYEGFGLPPLEAMACGTLALVSDLPALREATAGRALHIPPGDTEAWAEAIEAAVAGGAAAAAPPPWTWADAARQLAAVLAEIPSPR